MKPFYKAADSLLVLWAFELGEFRHYLSLEGDGYIRFFYTVLMRKKPQST